MKKQKSKKSSSRVSLQEESSENTLIIQDLTELEFLDPAEVVVQRPGNPALFPFHRIEELLKKLPQKDRSYYPIMKRPEKGKELKPIASPSGDKLKQFLRVHRGILEIDAYMGLNPMFRAGEGDSPEAEGFNNALRNERFARWLAVAYADLDCYRLDPPLPEGAIIGMLHEMQKAGLIPPPSDLLYSGRGLWAFWRLWDKRKNHPVRAWPEAVKEYKQIQKWIAELLALLGADPACTDVSRVCRIPGTLSSAIEDGGRVGFYTHKPGGSIKTYALEELNEWFNPRLIEERKGKRPRLGRFQTPKEISQKRKDAREMMLQLRFEQLSQLSNRRGGIDEGMRHRFLLILSVTLRGLGWTEKERREEIERLYSNFKTHSGFPPSQLKDVMKHDQIKGITSQKISDWLEVTPEESEYLAGLFRHDYFKRRKGLPPASRFKVERLSKAEKRAREIENRRAALQKIIEEARAGSLPTYRELEEELTRAGYKASKRTIGNDLEVLGIEGWNRPGPRRKKAKKARPRISLKGPSWLLIEERDLREPERLQKLFEEAKARELLRGVEADRLFFFGAAASVIRRFEKGRIKKPCGAFRRMIEDGLRDHVSQEDEDQALAALKALEGRL